MIKVVHITVKPGGGAGIAALRLQQAQLASGIAAAFVSKSLTLDFEGNQLQDPIMAYRRLSPLKRGLRRIHRSLFPNASDRIKQEYQALQSELNCEVASLPFSSIRLKDHPLVLAADIIHLHWVGEVLDYERFFADLNKPIVWTLHDRNPFSGLFHYSADELLNPQATPLDTEVRLLKAKALGNINKGAIIGPSQWITQQAMQSAAFGEQLLFKCVSNTISIENFANTDRLTARQELGIDGQELAFLFIAGRLDIHRKGSDLLKEALEMADFPMTLLTLGEGQIEINNKNVKTLPLGFRTGEQSLARCYAAADALVLPSREDNLPNTMLEAFATGIPVIAFDKGGMSEHVKTGLTGIKVSSVSAVALLEGIMEFSTQADAFSKDEIQAYANAHFSRKGQLAAYAKVYQNLLQ